MKGTFLPAGTPPPPPDANTTPNDWMPFRNRTEFETAEFLYMQNQMPAAQIDRLLDLWASSIAKHNDVPPLADHRDLYNVIDSSPFGDVKWQSFSLYYTDEQPEDNPPPWMDQQYEVWYCDPREVVHNMLANPTFTDEMDFCPYREYSTETDERQWKIFMSSDWAWEQAVSTSCMSSQLLGHVHTNTSSRMK